MNTVNYFITQPSKFSLQEFVELEAKTAKYYENKNHIIFFSKIISCFVENENLEDKKIPYTENIYFSLN